MSRASAGENEFSFTQAQKEIKKKQQIFYVVGATANPFKKVDGFSSTS